METSQRLIPTLFPISTVSFDDSLAKLFLSLESENDLKIPEERSSLNLREYCGQKNLDYSSLKMLKDCLVTTTEKLSAPSSPRLMSWGMTVNGKCLTAKITESHRIGSECTLSDILEEQVDQKYFLSDETMKKLVSASTGLHICNDIDDTTKCFEQTEQPNLSILPEVEVISPVFMTTTTQNGEKMI
jgi:hypothetical protein